MWPLSRSAISSSRSGLDHQLAADGEADPADPLGVDVGPAAQEVDGRADVLLAAPAVRVRVAVAGALAAAIGARLRATDGATAAAGRIEALVGARVAA